MKKGIWVASLALGLAARLAGLSAQENTWRPIAPPAQAPAPAWRAAAPSKEGAALGRPVPITRGVLGDNEPDYLPPRIGQPASRTIPPAGAIECGGERGDVIASAGPVRQVSHSAVVGNSPSDDGSEAVFASERRPALRGPMLASMPNFQPVPPPVSPPAPAPAVQAGNWSQLQPITPPPFQPGGPVVDGGFGGPPPPSHFYVRGEYLLWWAKQDHVPVLVTTGSVQSDGSAGILGRPDTVPLFGGALDRGAQSGARFTAGYWLGDCNSNAIEFSGFFLGQSTARFDANSSQFPVIARPFFDVNSGQEFVEQVSFPGRVIGDVRIESPSQLWGVEANWKCKMCCGCDYQVNALAGVRYLNLRESLTIVENLMFQEGAGALAGGQNVNVDSFSTRNEFYGGQVGVEGRLYRGRWSLDGRAKLAVGETHQTLDIAGGQSFTNVNTPIDTRPGGLLTTSSNIGTFSRDRFTVVPEVGINVGYALTPNLRASVGYNFLYWSSVARPGDQIDRNIDSQLVPNFNSPARPLTGLNRPAVLFKDSDYWAQGLTFSVELTF